MSANPTPEQLAQEYFQLKRHGDLAILIPSPEIEHLPDTTINTAAQMILAPLKQEPPTSLIVDLTGVRYFGSAFIAFLLRCHVPVKQQGGDLVLAGVNDRIRELLKTTALDTLWALYKTRQEAMNALGGSD